MLFNSYIFWAFFALVFVVYKNVSHKAQNKVLLIASYVFYGFWDYRFLSLIIISTVVDYFAAQYIYSSKNKHNKKISLAISLAFNLCLLGFFKYWNFFIDSFAALVSTLGLDVSVPILNIVLPVGISFYTFQTMSYTIDVYRGETKPTNRFFDFALYVSFFPQLVAGPIERSSHLLPQILLKRTTSQTTFQDGLFHVLTGLFKKVVIADNMAPIVNYVFSKPISDLTGPEVIVGVYAFAFQIYGDFSGYSSIAKGIAHWMGFDLMWNFKNPYFSQTPSEFWNRWHISLSSWLRDYLYIPLGGNKLGARKTFRNLVLTMGLGGLWHGAGWAFIVWGLFHGVLLVAYRLIGLNTKNSGWSGTLSISTVLNTFIMFQLVCIGWLFFRSESIEQAVSMIALIVTSPAITDMSVFGLSMIVFFVAPLMIYEYWTERKNDLLVIEKSKLYVQVMFYSYILLMLIIFPPLVNQEFIYFQF